MKSIFTKLSTLLLCGAVAMVSCTDFSEDIQAVDKKVDNLGSVTATELANLESAITALESKLAAQYATKDEVAALKTTLEQSIASEVEGLSKDIAAVSAALKTAKDDIDTAIAGLDNKKADKADVEAAVKTANDAIAALQGKLEAAKAEIEAEIEDVKAEIEATQEELAAQINGVDAKANELQNTLLSLSEYLKTLEAKINEVNNTLLSLSEYLEEYEDSVDAKFKEILNTFESLSGHLEEREDLVDAQLAELQATLLSLSYHLEEYEAVTDFKLVELQGSLAALSTYLEEYEESVDAKFEEILNTFTSLDLFLDEQFAEIAANDEALYAHVETLQEAFTALNNLLADEAAVREENDEALYAHIETLQKAFTALNNIVADLEAEDEAIYAEVEDVRTYVAQVYNALGLEIEAVDAALAAHVAAFEAYKEVLEAKLAGLEAEDGAIYTLIGTTTTALTNLIEDLQAKDEEIYAEIAAVNTTIGQIYNALSDEVAALETQLVDSVEGLESMIRDTQSTLTNALNLIADVEKKVEANAAAIASLEAAVEMLTAWALNHEDLYGELTIMIANLAAELDEQVNALQAEDGAIYDLIGKTATNLNNLIADATERIENIEVYVTENFNTVGAAIRSLENILNDITAEFGARLDSLENRMDKVEVDVEKLEVALEALAEALENGLAEVLAEAYKNDEGVMGNVRQFENKVINLVAELRKADADLDAKFSKEVADILVKLASIDAELADIADWQTSMNTTIAQLIEQFYNALGLLESNLQNAIEDAVALLTAEDAAIRNEIKEGLAEVLRLAFKNDEGVMDNVRQFELKMQKTVEELVARIAQNEIDIDALEETVAALQVALENGLADVLAKAFKNDEGIMGNVRVFEEKVWNLVAELKNADAKNKEELSAAIAAVVADLAKLQGNIDAKVAELEAKDAELAAELQKANNAIVSTQVDLYNAVARVEALEKAIKTLADINYVNGLHNEAMNANADVKAALNKLSKDIEAKIVMILAQQAADYTEIFAAIAAEAQKITALREAFETFQALTEEKIAALEAKDAELADMLERNVDQLYTAIKHLALNVDNHADAIAALKAAVAEADKLLQDQIDDLFARVQSLVYVPDYSDHKAVIDWAVVEMVGRNENYQHTIIAKESVLRYRVYAKAGESAAEAAKDIVDAWDTNNDILSYEVEPVKKVLWTRSADVPAGLEVRNVDVNKENPEIIDVTVVAKNFIPEFFWEDVEKYVADGELTEDEYQRPEKTSYSAAIVLSDGNNNLSSEYTNLVPGDYERFGLAVVDGTKQKNISFTTNSEAPRQLPYDLDNPDSVILLEDHSLVFIKPGYEDILYTPKEFMDLGFDLQLERRQHFIYPEDVVFYDYRVDGKDQAVPMGVADIKFVIHERDYVSELEEGNTYVTLTEPLTREQYIALEDKDIDIKFLYLVNGIEVWTQSTAQISNRLVEVEMDVFVPWTFETAMSTVKDGVIYAGKLNVEGVSYNLSESVKNNKSLSGYKLSTIIKEATDNHGKHNGGNYDIAISEINDVDQTFDIRLKSGSDKYQFPVNNNDDVTDYNTYDVTWKTDFEDLTITVKVNMHLGEQAPVQKLSTSIDFTPADGANGWLFGYWNVLESAFKKFKKDGYILEESKDAFIATFADATYDTPLVNGKAGIAQNTNVAFEAGENRFQLWHEQLDDEYVNGTKHRIQQTATPIFGTQFDFYVNGTVKLGAYALDLDGVRVVDGKVNVKGEIANNVYTVDVSDLAKYYYVVNEVGTKSLEAVNEGDVLTVDFSLAPMKDVKEDGFNFNGTTDLTEYSLNVDWTGELSKVPYILPMDKAVVNWGTYPHTEVEVNAVLKVNGFPVASKPITLVTTDPLEIALKDVTVEVTHLSGTNADPVVAKVYQNFELYSAVEEGNLFNTNATTIGGLWYHSKADKTYGATMNLEFTRVYYKVGEDEIGWDESKIVLDKYTTTNVVAPYEVGDLTGNVYIKKDDGDIETPIYVEFKVTMTHNIHDGSKTKCETSGFVTVKFVPEGYVEVAE